MWVSLNKKENQCEHKIYLIRLECLNFWCKKGMFSCPLNSSIFLAFLALAFVAASSASSSSLISHLISSLISHLIQLPLLCGNINQSFIIVRDIRIKGFIFAFKSPFPSKSFFLFGVWCNRRMSSCPLNSSIFLVFNFDTLCCVSVIPCKISLRWSCVARRPRWKKIESGGILILTL